MKRRQAEPDVVSRRTVLKGTGLGLAIPLVAACRATQTGDGNHDNNSRISVTDQRGKNVKLPGPARRVVTLPMPSASMLIAVDGGADHLVGMNRASWVAARGGLLGKIYPKILDLPHNVAREDFAPNVETILGLQPDVVIQWGDHGQGIITPLENAGLKVVGLSYGTQQDLAAAITLFATITGNSQRGKTILSKMDSDRSAIQARAKRQTGTRPKIVYVYQFTNGIKVGADDSYMDFFIRLAGGRNPAGNAPGLSGTGAAANIEQVLSWDPDIMLLSNFDPATPEDVYDDHVWSNVSAVRSRRVYKIPLGGYRWEPPCQESPLMWRWLSMITYPDNKPFNLRNEIVKYYDFLYNYKPSNRQIDKVLRMDVNKQSARYEQFAS